MINTTTVQYSVRQPIMHQQTTTHALHPIVCMPPYQNLHRTITSLRRLQPTPH